MSIKVKKYKVLHSDTNIDVRFKAALNIVASISWTKSMRMIADRRKPRECGNRTRRHVSRERERWRRCAQLTFPLLDDTGKALCGSAVVPFDIAACKHPRNSRAIPTDPEMRAKRRIEHCVKPPAMNLECTVNFSLGLKLEKFEMKRYARHNFVSV